MLELVDGILKLLVKYHPVGNHNDRIEYLVVVPSVEARQSVGQPRYGIALSAARRMLDEVIVTGPFRVNLRDEFSHHIELVIPRKYHGFLLYFFILYLPLLHLKVHETGDYIQKGVPLPDVFPEIGGAEVGGIVGVTPSAVAAQVERQKESGFAR